MTRRGRRARRSVTCWPMPLGWGSRARDDRDTRDAGGSIRTRGSTRRAVVAERAGKAVEDALRAVVLDPLGMTGSTLRERPSQGLHGPMADAGALAAELLRPTLVAPRPSRLRRRWSSRGSSACCRAWAGSIRSIGASVSSCTTGSRRIGRGPSTARPHSAISAGRGRSCGSTRTRTWPRRAHRPRVRCLGARGVAAVLGCGPRRDGAGRRRRLVLAVDPAADLGDELVHVRLVVAGVEHARGLATALDRELARRSLERPRDGRSAIGRRPTTGRRSWAGSARPRARAGAVDRSGRACSRPRRRPVRRVPSGRGRGRGRYGRPRTASSPVPPGASRIGHDVSRCRLFARSAR